MLRDRLLRVGLAVLAALLGTSIGPVAERAVSADVAETCSGATPVPGAGTPGAESAPPWGIQHVTTPELTADRFIQALPCEFSRYQLVDLPELIATLPVYPFSTESENRRYYVGPRPADVPYAVVNISTLPSGLAPAAAITQVIAAMAQQPYFAVEAEDVAADAAVPFVLLQQDGGHAVGPVWALVWGARDGRDLFTVSAVQREDLATLVRLIVANLEERLGTPATPPGR
jgi:hypothetical protein